MRRDQSSIEFTELACPSCPYGVSGRCPGPDEDCLKPDDDRFIGCFEPARQMSVYLDLHRAVSENNSVPLPATPRLPAVVHVVQKGLPVGATFPATTMFGASYSSILGVTGELLPQDGPALRARLRLPQSCRIGVIGTCADPLLEAFWKKSEVRDVWPRFGSLRLEFAVGSSFSVVTKSPRFDRIFNQERNFYVTERLIGAGVYGIPLLFFEDDTPHDVEAILGWLAEHPEVEVVALSAQLVRGKKSFGEFLRSSERLRQRLDPKMGIMVIGVATADRIRAAYGSLGRVTIVTNQAVTTAIYNQALSRDLVARRANLSTPISELATRNVEHLQRFCDREWQKAA